MQWLQVVLLYLCVCVRQTPSKLTPPHPHSAALAFAASTVEAGSYFLITKAANGGTLNYAQAKTRCAQLGCVLTKINNEQENANIIAMATAAEPLGNCWIGLDDLAEEGTFRWVEDNSILQPTDYEDWCRPGLPLEAQFPDNPSNGPGLPENCGSLFQKSSKCDGFGRWNDAKCEQQFPLAACRCLK